MPGPIWTLRLAREHLIFKALCALDEAIDQAKDGPVAPSFALRFALAFLFACSDGKREPYDSFWKVIRDAYESAHSDVQRRYQRPTDARIQLRGILRSLGWADTHDLGMDLAVARGVVEDNRPALAAHKRRLAEERESAMAEDRRSNPGHYERLEKSLAELELAASPLSARRSEDHSDPPPRS